MGDPGRLDQPDPTSQPYPTSQPQLGLTGSVLELLLLGGSHQRQSRGAPAA